MWSFLPISPGYPGPLFIPGTPVLAFPAGRGEAGFPFPLGGRLRRPSVLLTLHAGISVIVKTSSAKQLCSSDEVWTKAKINCYRVVGEKCHVGSVSDSDG